MRSMHLLSDFDSNDPRLRIEIPKHIANVSIFTGGMMAVFHMGQLIALVTEQGKLALLQDGYTQELVSELIHQSWLTRQSKWN